jgi:glycosyltransferase involved in cell wall biosynthesis
LADHFNQTLNVEMKVVRNVPYMTNFDKLKHNNKTLIFQGNYNKGRGLELAIRSLAYLPDFNLIIVGGGFEFLKDLCRKIGVLDRVEFVGKVPFEQVKEFTKKATIGLLLEEPLGLSFTYSLPNKLFDYIHSDLKIIASPLKEVKSVLDKYKMGVLLNNRNPKDLAAQIDMLYNIDFNDSDYQIAKQELNWQKEQEVLESIFFEIKK